MSSLCLLLLLVLWLPQVANSSPVSLHPRAITFACQAGETTNCITGTVQATTTTGTLSNGETITETLFPTTLSDLSAVTASTTITTTDASGATVLAVVGAAGAAYLVYEGIGAGLAGGLPVEPLPTPEAPDFTLEPTTSVPTTTTPTTSSSSPSETDTMTLEQIPFLYTGTIDPGPTLVAVPLDVRACNAAGDKDPDFDLSFAESTIPDFCKTNAGKDIGNNTVDEILSIGAGKELNITVSALSIGCDSALGQTKLDEHSCSYYLGQVVNGCDTNSNTVKHGGIIQNGCLQYSLAAQVSDGKLYCKPTDLPNLPGLPRTSSDTVSYADQTGLNRASALSRIESFCANITNMQVNGRDIKRGETGLALYYNPSKGNTQMNISLTYSEDVSCPQSGDNAVYRTDRASCGRFLDSIIDDCNTNFHGAYGKFGGTLTDGCGRFGINTINVEPISCADQGEAIPEAVTTAAIDQFCSQGYHLDPKKKIDPTQFYQSPPDGAAWADYTSDGYRVYTELEFGSLPQNTGCQIQQSRFTVDGDECKRRLHAVADKCRLNVNWRLTSVPLTLFLSRRQRREDGSAAT